MKRFLSLLGLVALATPSLWAQRSEFEIKDVTASIIKTPDINYSGERRRTPSARDWIEIEMTFEAKPEFTDELTARYYIAIGDSVQAVNQNGVLVGEVTHVSVGKSGECRSVMYVAPNTLSRLLAGKNPGTGSIQGVGVELLKQGQLVAQKSSKGAPNGPWWQTYKQVPGLVLNKNETPFAPLYWDRYEAIKSGGR